MCLNFARSPKLFLRSQSVVLARSLGCPPPADECATVSLSLSSRIFAWPVFHPLGGITRSSVPATSSFVERVDGSYGSKDISVKNRGTSLFLLLLFLLSWPIRLDQGEEKRTRYIQGRLIEETDIGWKEYISWGSSL